MKTSSDGRFSSGLGYIKRRVAGAGFVAAIENGERARLCVEVNDANVGHAAAVIIDAVADVVVNDFITFLNQNCAFQF